MYVCNMLKLSGVVCISVGNVFVSAACGVSSLFLAFQYELCCSATFSKDYRTEDPK